MKKQSMILEMFNGNRGRYEQIQMTEEYWDLVKRAEESENKFLEAVGDKKELVELFQKAKESAEDMWSNECDSHFCEGVRFGVLFGMDVLSNE